MMQIRNLEICEYQLEKHWV